MKLLLSFPSLSECDNVFAEKCASAANNLLLALSHTHRLTASRLQSVMSFDFVEEKKKSGPNCLVLIGRYAPSSPACTVGSYTAVRHLLRRSQTRPNSAVSATVLSYWNRFYSFFILPLRSSLLLTAGCLGCLCKENCRGRRKITAVGDNERVTRLDLNVAWCDCYQSVNE